MELTCHQKQEEFLGLFFEREPAMVESPRLFAEKEREPVTTHTTGDLESSFEESPETFNTIGMHVTVHIHTALMIDLLV